MQKLNTSYDVIVVGSGGSGLAAAASAAENGLSVLMLEKRPDLGGTTGIAVGSFTANSTRYQRQAGINDTPEAHNEDAGKFSAPEIEAVGNYDMRGFFLTHAADTLEWLISKGLAFYGPSPEPPNRVPRMHNVVPNAKAYIAVLQADLLKHRGEICANAPVQELIYIENRVAGVRAEIKGINRDILAKFGVVLAAGDYSNNPDMIATYKGERFRTIEGINPYATGDGHVLAQSIGASLINMDITYGPELRFVPPPRKPFSQMLPSSGIIARLMGMLLPLIPRVVLNAMIRRLLVAWQHPENALFDDGAILVNIYGERFCNERIWPDREIAISSQPTKVAFIVLDQRLIDRYNSWPHFISTAPEIAYAYVNTYLRMRPDISVEGASLSEVSRLRGLPLDAIKQTVNEFNRYVTGDIPDRFNRIGDVNQLSTGRTVLLGPLKAYFTTTEGGVNISRNMEALDKQGRPIPGLYAVGQNGLGGQVLWGHGLHISWAITSGRLVGKVIANKR